MAVNKKNDSKFKKIIGYVAYVLAFLLAFYVVKEIRNESNIQNISANVENNIKDKNAKIITPVFLLIIFLCLLYLLRFLWLTNFHHTSA